MLTKELKSLIKLSEKRGKFDYYDGLMYYMLAHNVPPLALSYVTDRYILKVNKILKKDVGRRIFRDDVTSLQMTHLNESVFNEIHDKFKNSSPNYIFMESFSATSYIPLRYGFKISYKMALPSLIDRIAGGRMGYSYGNMNLGIDSSLNTAKRMIVRDEEIIRSILSQIPDELYFLNTREFDLPISDEYRLESDLRYNYTFEADESKYISKNFGDPNKEKTFSDLIKIRDLERLISYKWLFSKYNTIKEFIESNPF